MSDFLKSADFVTLCVLAAIALAVVSMLRANISWAPRGITPPDAVAFLGRHGKTAREWSKKLFSTPAGRLLIALAAVLAITSLDFFNLKPGEVASWVSSKKLITLLILFSCGCLIFYSKEKWQRYVGGVGIVYLGGAIAISMVHFPNLRPSVCSSLTDEATTVSTDCTFGYDTVWIAASKNKNLDLCIDPVPASKNDYVLWYIDSRSATPRQWHPGERLQGIKKIGFQAPADQIRSVSYRSVRKGASCG